MNNYVLTKQNKSNKQKTEVEPCGKRSNPGVCFQARTRAWRVIGLEKEAHLFAYAAQEE